MKKFKYDSTDRLIWELTRPMWFLLSILAVYILYLSVKMTDSSSAVDMDLSMIYSLLEHLLAGCAVTLATGAALEYISKKMEKNNEDR